MYRKINNNIYLPIISIFLYGFISTSITLFNKVVLGVYKFNIPNILTLYQIILSIILLYVLKKFKYIDYQDIEYEKAIKIAPLSISFLGMVITGLSALNYLNVPMFGALRRITTVITMWCELFILQQNISYTIQGSVYAMFFGGIIAAFFDLDFNLMGYLMVGINSIFTAGYLILISKLGRQGLDTFGLMYYNNVISLPFVIILCIINGDFIAFMDYTYLTSIEFWVVFNFSSIQAFLLNYSIFFCTKANSALTTSVVGQIKNIATTLIGYFCFGDVSYDPYNVAGLVIGVVASVVYSWYQFIEESNKKATAASNIKYTELETVENNNGSAISIDMDDDDKPIK